MTLITVQMEDYELLNMLLDRLDYWGREDERDLYEKMYQNYLDSGVFECMEFNVNYIVDNDVVNYCSVISREDYPKDYDKLLELYEKGERDVSCEEFEELNVSYIEAVSHYDEKMLIRY